MFVEKFKEHKESTYADWAEKYFNKETANFDKEIEYLRRLKSIRDKANKALDNEDYSLFSSKELWELADSYTMKWLEYEEALKSFIKTCELEMKKYDKEKGEN